MQQLSLPKQILSKFIVITQEILENFKKHHRLPVQSGAAGIQAVRYSPPWVRHNFILGVQGDKTSSISKKRRAGSLTKSGQAPWPAVISSMLIKCSILLVNFFICLFALYNIV